MQKPDGAIPWFDIGVFDPWNHTEAAMGLAVLGRVAEAKRAYDHLAATQEADGSWWAHYGSSVSLDTGKARLKDAVRTYSDLDRQLTQTRTKLDSLRGKGSPIEALRGVLTTEQQRILDKNLAESPRDGRGFGPGRGPGMGADGFGPGRGRSPNGMGPRGFRDGPPPRRPAAPTPRSC